jgi:aminoglycoside/choline kinase family phosphotransferase
MNHKIADTTINGLNRLIRECWGCDAMRIEGLGAHASNRQIYRCVLPDNIQHNDKFMKSVIGVICPDLRENRAFIHFTQQFHAAKFSVPEIFAVSDDETTYIETDLGDQTLFDLLPHLKTPQNRLNERGLNLYQHILSDLIRFQTSAWGLIQPEYCTESAKFDAQNFTNDFRLFLKNYAQQIGVMADIQEFHDDIAQFQSLFLSADSGYFLYRDFQSRNIMIMDDVPVYIDYQSARLGALEYDVASLLYQSQANLDPKDREILLQYYGDQLRQKGVDIPQSRLNARFILFVFMRIIQILGVYGYQGLVLQKSYFKESIPYALENLRYVLANWPETMRPTPKIHQFMYDILNQQGT